MASERLLQRRVVLSSNGKYVLTLRVQWLVPVAFDFLYGGLTATLTGVGCEV